MTLYFGRQKHMEEYYMMWLSRIPSIGVHKSNAVVRLFWHSREYLEKLLFRDLAERER